MGEISDEHQARFWSEIGITHDGRGNSLREDDQYEQMGLLIQNHNSHGHYGGGTTSISSLPSESCPECGKGGLVAQNSASLGDILTDRSGYIHSCDTKP